ncbi:hypothetical protein ACH6EH_08430 [Paenibacillus sp. JSM ZJ436]
MRFPPSPMVLYTICGQGGNHSARAREGQGRGGAVGALSIAGAGGQGRDSAGGALSIAGAGRLGAGQRWGRVKHRGREKARAGAGTARPADQASASMM